MGWVAVSRTCGKTTTVPDPSASSDHPDLKLEPPRVPRRNTTLGRKLRQHFKSPAERQAAATLIVAASKARQAAHAMLDTQLDAIMPELLAAIDAGRSFAVLVVDPERMPVIPEPSKLLDAAGAPLRA